MTSDPQTEQPTADTPPRRIAIVGAGPSGLFAAQSLVTQTRLPVEVDVFDRLPTPYGLLRYGVAPDHESIRSVAGALAAVFASDRIRFCGLAELGAQVSREELLGAYDAVIYATGANEDLRLGIPGEELLGSTSAREFVAWYGGHPDARAYDLVGVRTAAAIGMGNVAVDVARLLVKNPTDLEWTDMPGSVLEALHASTVRDVYIIGRRGPQHGAFTVKELRELCTLPGVQVSVSEEAFEGIDETSLDRRCRANVETLRAAAARSVPEPRARLHFEFWRRPVEVLGDTRVSGLLLERTRWEDGRVVGTGRFETIPLQLVLRAIGSRSDPLPGVSFDLKRGIVPNVEGRVTTVKGRLMPREYVTGWVKRGPIGVIGSNKSDAAQTVGHLLDDLVATGPQPATVDLWARMAERGFQPSTLADWHRIDAAEAALGADQGRTRMKIAEWDELLRLAQYEPPTP